MYKTFIKAIKKIIKAHNVDENALICISAIGAYLLGEHMEGFMVLLLYVLGKILEDKAVHKSRSSIKDLVELKTNYANLKVNKRITKVKSENLKIGDIIVVKKVNLFLLMVVLLKGMLQLIPQGLLVSLFLEKLGKEKKCYLDISI